MIREVYRRVWVVGSMWTVCCLSTCITPSVSRTLWLDRDVAANTIHKVIMFSSYLLEYASVVPAFSWWKSHGNKNSIWWYGDTQASRTVLSPSGMHRCLQISVNKGSVHTQGYLPRKEKGNPCIKPKKLVWSSQVLDYILRWLLLSSQRTDYVTHKEMHFRS